MTVNNCKSCNEIDLLDSPYKPGQLSHTGHDTRDTGHDRTSFTRTDVGLETARVS